jgi:PAS domain S-box-containing protein
MANHDVEETSSTERVLDFLTALVPCFCMGFAFLPIVFAIAGIKMEETELSELVRSCPADVRHKASQRFLAQASHGPDSLTSDRRAGESGDRGSRIWVLLICGVVLEIFLLMFPLVYANWSNKRLRSVYEECLTFGLVRHGVFHMGYQSLMGIMLTEKQGLLGYADVQDHIKSVEATLAEVRILNGFLEKGDSIYSQKLEDILVSEKCSVGENVGSDLPINYYKCLSFERLLGYYVDMLKSRLALIDQEEVLSSQTAVCLHLICSGLALGFRDILDEYEVIFEERLDVQRNVAWACCLLAMGVALMGLFAEMVIKQKVNREIETFKSLLSRLDPVAFVENVKILRRILGRKVGDDIRLMSATHALFHVSRDAMLSLTRDGIIETVNPATTTMFGYKSEQILGQNLTVIMNPDLSSNNALFSTIGLMKAGQCPLCFQAEVFGKRDDEKMVPVRVILVGFSRDSRIAESFALVCRDMTDEIKDREAVEAARREGEHLLRQVIPREMLQKIDHDEMTFSAPQVTVIYLNICHFSSYLTTVSIDELFRNVRKIFGEFDSFVDSLPSIQRIGIMGDRYIATAGLFAVGAEPQLAAKEGITFGLKCLDAIEELNIQLSTLLQLKIGMHTGGPLIAGVMSDRRVFEVIGDSIGFADELQKAAVPGTVNISEPTYNLIREVQVQFDPHGDIELGHLGKVKTYSVTSARRGVLDWGLNRAGSTGSAYGLASEGSDVYVPPSLDSLLANSSFVPDF